MSTSSKKRGRIFNREARSETQLNYSPTGRIIKRNFPSFINSIINISHAGYNGTYPVTSIRDTHDANAPIGRQRLLTTYLLVVQAMRDIRMNYWWHNRDEYPPSVDDFTRFYCRCFDEVIS